MSESKRRLLEKLRSQTIEGRPLPEVLEGNWIHFDDPHAKFAEAVQFVGGVCHSLDSISELPGRLAEFQQFREAKRIFSTIPEVPGNVDVNAVDDAHDLDNLDFVVYPAQFAVAENGAVWLTDENLKHRVVFFITQFLVIVVRRSDMVQTMHDAYARAKPPRPGFGLFLSAPARQRTSSNRW